MKTNKLKIITIILLILLITMIGFFGIYYKDKNTMKNGILGYKFASDLTGKKVITMEVDNSTKEIIKDAEGNVIESATDEEISEKGYKKEETKVNSEDKLTADNYALSKEIIEKRLNKLGISDYNVRVDEENGKIITEIPESDENDEMIQNLTTVGKFEIIDTQTKEVLLNNNDIKDCEIFRNGTSSGTSVYFSIGFKEDAKKKLEEISKTYVKSEETKTEENTENAESSENAEKTITMQLDGSQIMSTSFEQPITDGKMYLTVGKESTDIETLKQNLGQARKNVAILSNTPLPLTYETKESNYVLSQSKDRIEDKIIIGVAAILVIATIILVVKYKSKGLIVATSNIGFSALFLLIIRYWNVILSKEGVLALFGVVILNCIFTNNMLKNINQKNAINTALKQFTLKIIPIVLIGVMFSFSSWSQTSSFGMVIFWGITIIELYNLIITKSLLNTKKCEER